MTKESGHNDSISTPVKAVDNTRRRVLPAAALAGGTLMLGAPYIRDAQAASTQVCKTYSTWDAGTSGYKLFEE